MTRWERFLDEAIGDAWQIEKFRQWVEAILTCRKHENILVLTGEAKSGKTVLINVLMRLVGENKTMMGLPTAENLYWLKGKKLLVIFEEMDGRVEELAGALKTLQGGDILPCRQMYSEDVNQIRPTVGIVCERNVPLSNKDSGLLARSFQLQMHQPEKTDRHLLEELLFELEYIRKWAIDDSKNPDMSGAGLIVKERKEQLVKHGYNADHDDQSFNDSGELKQAALFLLTDGLSPYPKGWSAKVEKKFSKKGAIEKLVVAGALIAAEIDRLNRIERGA